MKKIFLGLLLGIFLVGGYNTVSAAANDNYNGSFIDDCINYMRNAFGYDNESVYNDLTEDEKVIYDKYKTDGSESLTEEESIILGEILIKMQENYDNNTGNYGGSRGFCH